MTALPPPLGLLGGTFDPVHVAHLRLAEEARVRLGLARVRWIPSGRPGHRGAPATPAAHRVEMVRLAVRDNPHFEIDDAEARDDAAGFTLDTLARVRAALGDDVPLVFIIGADQLLAFHTWRAWERLLDLAHFAIGERPGYPLALDELAPDVRAAYARREAAAGALADRPAGCMVRFSMTLLDISASDIRRRLGAGESVRYLLPPEVLAYIAAHGLYGARRDADA